ncbi:hypothetical protein ATANTOWER_006570 [Ataeniobius toweri]|uniref:Secreted protein n=1 Tax=Ataeniobius toweri TaxID=208326 RepID=A0ABU7BH33_9TELE|nr:hypothetical protein [Ataeniobius toweri]
MFGPQSVWMTEVVDLLPFHFFFRFGYFCGNQRWNVHTAVLLKVLDGIEVWFRAPPACRLSCCVCQAFSAGAKVS